MRLGPAKSGARPRQRESFGQDFRRFFTRGLAALLPTLITIWLLLWAWEFLYENIGQHLIHVIKLAQWHLAGPDAQAGNIDRMWDQRLPVWLKQAVGVGLAVVLVYIVGLLVGNLIGRTFWKLGETLAMRVPIVRAIYPAAKQVTDFILQDRQPFEGSRVVAIQPHEQQIWSLGLVTGALPPLTAETGHEMVTVFVPNSPMALTGYVLVVPRNRMVELPMTVEQMMRLLVSGGVISPPIEPAARLEPPAELSAKRQ